MLRDWEGWLELLQDRFGPDPAPVRNAWNRVRNQLQRDWLLVDAPTGDEALRRPALYPDIRHLSVADATAEVEHLVDSGGWTTADQGLRLHQVWRRLRTVAYVSVYDALHEMNGRNHLVTTTAPSGKPSQFWYVRAD